MNNISPKWATRSTRFTAVTLVSPSPNHFVRSVATIAWLSIGFLLRRQSRRLHGRPILVGIELGQRSGESALWAPKLRSYTLPHWLTMKVMTPDSPQCSG